MSADTNLNRSRHSAFPADVLAVALADRRSRRKIETEQPLLVGGGRSSRERQPPDATLCSLCLRRSVDDRYPRLNLLHHARSHGYFVCRLYSLGAPSKSA